MIRRAFLRRMAFAALATWFVDLPLPPEVEEVSVAPIGSHVVVEFFDRASGAEMSITMEALPVYIEVGESYTLQWDGQPEMSGLVCSGIVAFSPYGEWIESVACA